MTNQEKNINIAYIGGGSMNFGWKFIGELCQEENLSGVVRLYDLDKKLSLANEVIGNNTKNLPECKTKMIFLAVDTLEEALRDADFVVISITVGEMQEISSDAHLPEMYGIYQSCGDNSGPGGIMRTLRTLPEYIKIANSIKELCPNAWVISLSNPMSACINVLHKAFPEIKALGCSNDIFSVEELIAEMVSKYYNVPDVSIRDIKTNVLGINTFCWISEAMYNGNNLFELYADYARKYADNGYENKKIDVKSNPFASAHRVQFDMFLRYGLIAASSDRRMVENCPPWYISSSKVASSWKYGVITPSYLKKRKLERIEKCRKLVSGDEYLRIGWSGTDCIAQIKAILGLGNLITNAVCINKGQITNLPEGAVVETNALFSNNSVKPVLAGEIPPDVKVLMQRQISNTNLLVESVMMRDLDSAFNVFLNDPLMTLSIDKATELYRQMLSVNKSYMAYYC